MTRVFKIRSFGRFAAKEAITDKALLKAAEELEGNKFDADLGGGVFKQRLARTGGGKAGGYRIVVCFKRGSLAFFVYGFAKSDQANISSADERDLKRLARLLLSLSARQIEKELKAGRLTEIEDKRDG